MRRMNNLVTLFTAMFAFFFGCFISTMLNVAEKCTPEKHEAAKLEPHPELFLVILILSTPFQVDRRRTMRETWLTLGRPLTLPYYPEEYVYLPHYDERGHLQLESVADQSERLKNYIKWKETVHKHKTVEIARNIRVKHFFAVGTKSLAPGLVAELEREKKEFDDMLLLPRLYDTYSNLTQKMLQSLEALTGHYKFSYLLKVDDDTYVKLDEFLNELVSYDRKRLRKMANYHEHPLPELYWGYFKGHANIKRNGIFTENNYFLSSHYITYALGGGYVLSHKICKLIVTNEHMLSRYVSEDISMGTWLAAYRHIYRRHDPRFDTQYMARKCQDYHLVLHKRDDQLMNDLYQGKLCTFESAKILTRPSEYFYDWQKPSYSCCKNVVT